MYKDRVKIVVVGGRGGDGCVSFRREKYIPKGGPDGGDGGRGGDVVLRFIPSLDDLSHLKAGSTYRAENGKPGSGGKKHGRDGDPLFISVPAGTSVHDEASGKAVTGMHSEKNEIIVAKGGRGGRGNVHFATSTDRTPRKREKGVEGKKVKLRLEYIPSVDACIVGGPNSGKSTLLSILTSARPKIADYPFTTRMPALGVFQDSEGKVVRVMEVPAIVEGSRGGKGFGVRWMRYVSRSRVVIFLVDVREEAAQGVYESLLRELSDFDKAILEKPRVLVLSKIDLLDRESEKLEIENQKETPVLRVSLVTGTGLKELKDMLLEMLHTERGRRDDHSG